MLKKFLLFSICCCSIAVSAQDSLYTRQVIETLCSKQYAGRGYVKQGDHKAATYISAEFAKSGLQPIGESYFQPFQFPVNTFPSRLKVVIDGKKLIVGTDYIVHPASSGCRSTFITQQTDSLNFISDLSADTDSCLVIDNKFFNAQRDVVIDLLKKKKKGAVVFLEENKLTWSVATYHFNVPVLVILKKKFPVNAQKISINIKSHFNTNHHTRNVVAIEKGKVASDSFIVFTAHYDHLGMMGKKAIFPGANDNASGVAMLLNLARHYVKNPSGYSIVFIAFAGEEAGLIGSLYFTEHPMIDLKKIKFLVNLDLLGTGDDGMMVVNATEHQKEFVLMKSINDENNYLSSIGERGKARNSDHYYFTEKGVPAFFLYTLGGIKAYHDIDDKAATLPLTKFKEVFRLITTFADSL